MSVIDRLNAALHGRYRVERELGEGGMATVYLADDVRHGRRVALKVLKPELSAAVDAERFLAEIRTTANLQHPHILPLFDSGEADGLLFYVMPFVQGESLRETLAREGRLPVDDAVRIAASVGDALEHAHGHGIIHRDVKPANVMISDGEPLLADFGIALAMKVRELADSGSPRRRQRYVWLVQDIMRTVDFVEEQPDLDDDRIAYLGMSFGAELALPVALEKRFRTSVLIGGALDPAWLGGVPEEAAPWNFVARITTPTLLVNGRYDFMHPYEEGQVPFFDMIDVPDEDKEFVVLPTGHVPPNNEVIAHALRWLDERLGPVVRARD